MNNLLIEIRQGIGGNESKNFIEELYLMYKTFFEKKKIYFKIIKNEKEIIFNLKNNEYEKFLLNESGIHRVQRIPKTENQGRLHTSTCSVFVSKNFIFENSINEQDLQIEVCRSSGSGGQHVNKTNSAVKITHLPTNIIAECSDERSQKLNKNKAMLILKMKILKLKKENANLELNFLRKNIISNSVRSKKIRTYNFHTKKIINHINNKHYQLEKILNGNLDLMFK